MAFQFSVAARNAALDGIEAAIGASPTLNIRTGAPPANAGATATGTVLASLTLPANWLADASGGSKSLAGTWEDLAANAAGTAGHFEIVQGATRHIQGTVTATGDGGDMEIQNTSIAVDQQITVTAFTLTAGGA